MMARLGRQVGTLALDGCLLTTQTAVYPFNWWLSNRISLRAYLPNNFSVPRGTLVLANHVSIFDPFLVTFHLGRQNWLSTVPMRYPATPDYARHRVIGPVIKALGAYDIGELPIEKAKKLLYTRDLLNRGRTVLLFPEGRIVNKGHLVGDFKRGARMLFAHDYPTVFAHLLGFTTESFLHPERVHSPRIHYSSVITGSAEEKIARMEVFFSSHA